jgi:hypothetical protein
MGASHRGGCIASPHRAPGERPHTPRTSAGLHPSPPTPPRRWVTPVVCTLCVLVCIVFLRRLRSPHSPDATTFPRSPGTRNRPAASPGVVWACPACRIVPRMCTWCTAVSLVRNRCTASQQAHHAGAPPPRARRTLRVGVRDSPCEGDPEHAGAVPVSRACIVRCALAFSLCCALCLFGCIRLSRLHHLWQRDSKHRRRSIIIRVARDSRRRGSVDSTPLVPLSSLSYLFPSRCAGSIVIVKVEVDSIACILIPDKGVARASR